MEPQPQLEPSPVVSIGEASRQLTISVRSIWRLIASGELAVVRIGRSVRVTRQSIEAFVEKGGTDR